jgi:hypothetical protein
MKVNKDISPLPAIVHVCPSKEYKGFDSMGPLLLAMVHKDPEKRPTIDQVVNRFAAMCKKLGTFKLRARVGPRDESLRAVRNFAHLFTTIKYILKGTPPVFTCWVLPSLILMIVTTTMNRSIVYPLFPTSYQLLQHVFALSHGIAII